jgi:hypothetical protein
MNDPTGEDLADAGAAAALDSAAVTVWRSGAQAAMDELIRHGHPFDADDVTALAGPPPSPNAMGGLFRANRSRLTAVGYTKTDRKVGHARVIRIWQARPTGPHITYTDPTSRLVAVPLPEGEQPQAQLAVDLVRAEAAIARVRYVVAAALQTTAEGRGYTEDHWRGQDYVEGRDVGIESLAAGILAALDGETP